MGNFYQNQALITLTGIDALLAVYEYQQQVNQAEQLLAQIKALKTQIKGALS